jgi:PAT family beta-lactamase induction signal transducer AmpG
VDVTPHPSGTRNPWLWVPSLYFAQGIPYVIVMTVAVIMFKRLGVSNSRIAFYTSVLYLPWVIKPLWSPLVQRVGSRRGWTVLMQLLVGAALGCTALAIPAEDFVRYTMATLAFVAVASATHDVAADGFYLLALTSHQQAFFVGIRSTAYRLATIAGQGLLVMLAGQLESATGLPIVRLEAVAADRPLASAAFEPSAGLEPATGDQRIVVANQRLELSLGERPKSDVESLLEQVQEWNVRHGFYAAPEAAAAAADKPGWVSSLETVLRNWFGPRRSTEAASDVEGDVVLVSMQLTQPVPEGAQQVVQFGRASGDASFFVREGERFVVTHKNWRQPFISLVQVESKLNGESTARFEIRSGNIPLAWMATFFLAAAVFTALFIYHYFALPRPAGDIPAPGESGWAQGFLQPFASFFQKPRIGVLLAFLLLYRLPEAQAIKLVTPFLLDAREKDGLALTTGEVGLVYGTIGIMMLMLGGILGGMVVARDGLRRWLWPMALAIHLPNIAFLFLSYVQPESLAAITAAIGVEQFGYGFGFTAYMMYCIYIARGEHQTVHYALCTGFMALGMMIPGMWSGWLQQLIGYEHFFVWVMLCTLPSFIAVALIPLEADFGKKSPEEAT